MNNSSRFSPSSRSSGFTLVEILVVIAIIAILAAVILSGASTAINAAKRIKAGNTATQIQAAVYNYNTEYGVYPVPSTAAATADFFYNSTDTTNWPNLMTALCGNISPITPGTVVAGDPVPNTRQIPFLTPRRSDVDNTYGVLINPFTTSASTPPQYFNLVVDSDSSGVAGDTGTAKGAMPDFVSWTTGGTIQYLPSGVTQGVAVWCDCDPKNITTPTSSTAPQFWVRTY